MKQPEQAIMQEARSPGKACRAFELDALRGLALLMMILHHLIFDLRYLLELPVFAMQETWWFENLLRPVFLCVFIVVSGICSTFSRNNAKRGLRLGAVALAFTIATWIASRVSGLDLYIFFNILHLLAFGTLLYAWVTRREKGGLTDVILILLAVVTAWAGTILPERWTGTPLLLPLGLVPVDVPGMSDYLPLFPWLGFFLAGALIGRIQYRDRCSAFPNPPQWLIDGTRPLVFMGQKSLIIYVLHQPILLGVLYGLRAVGVI